MKLSQYLLVVKDIGEVCGSTAESVDYVMLDMFAQKQMLYEAIPSTQEVMKVACGACY